MSCNSNNGIDILNQDSSSCCSIASSSSCARDIEIDVVGDEEGEDDDADDCDDLDSDYEAEHQHHEHRLPQHHHQQCKPKILDDVSIDLSTTSINKNRRLNPFSIESLLSSNSGLSVSMITNRKGTHHNRNHNINNNNNNNINNNNNNNNNDDDKNNYNSSSSNEKVTDLFSNESSKHRNSADSRCDKIPESELNHNHTCHKHSSDQMSFVVTMSATTPTANFTLNTNSNVNINVQSNHNFNSHNHSFNYSDDYVRNKNDTDSGNSAMSSYDEGDN
jgi:hypothetical protein